MEALGQVDNIVCSKSAFFSTVDAITVAFKIENHFFQNKRVQTESKIIKPNFESCMENNILKDVNSSDDDDMYEYMNYLPN